MSKHIHFPRMWKVGATGFFAVLPIQSALAFVYEFNAGFSGC